jgi:hypothetical protein
MGIFSGFTKSAGGTEENKSHGGGLDEYDDFDDLTEKELLQMMALDTYRTAKNVAFFFWAGLSVLAIWALNALGILAF